ncbi:sulfite exporter TauE/SafE family protein [Aliiroseovarius sp. F47248L]|uniref:sulfite exporter TauE/SafE family protein n=1 Tax=Aliiroseovarius sp. F47248L TaxID=2926420 RepID=UPI001FF33E2F|nr:sulfite exporter TauE/SafE family protein [Aliiroseovarius sp. F47248L]MCK0138181.1 sulfite exporter TauE/SafE family protein [Aliiroseovarius sp. F47248L]
MPDLLAQALALPGLGWLLIIAFIAGLVRGFAGFGTALIFLPVAAQIIDPVWAVTVLIVMDLAGPAPAIPRALKEGHPKDLLRLVVATALALPFGMAVLFAVDPHLFKLAVSVISLIMLAALMAGKRFGGEVTPPIVWTTGGIAGLLGGAAGIPGPPVILLYMASSHPARVIRANTTAYLFFFDLMLLAGFFFAGRLAGMPLILGALVTLPNLLGNLVGGAVFNPRHESRYRYVAYLIIAASSMSGLYAALF